MIERSYYSFGNIIDEGEVATVVAVVENLDRFVVDNGIGKQKECHIGPAPGAVDGKKAKTGCRQIIEVTVGVRHELVGLFAGGVERERMIDIVMH